MTNPASRLIVALDLPDRPAAIEAVERLSGVAGCFKVGLELFVREGPALVEALAARGESVFLDLKLHDIPNTVASAVRSASRLGVRFLTLHASGGGAMLEAAREAALEADQPPILLAVTVLTSLGRGELDRIGVGCAPAAWAERLASLAAEAGIRGLVCSAQEAPAMRNRFGRELTLVVPGIRPAGSAQQDQGRIATPAEAMRAGADYIVVGRPILKAPDPREAAIRIAAEMESGLQPAREHA